jgi:hypothetical protein
MFFFFFFLTRLRLTNDAAAGIRYVLNRLSRFS